MFRHLGSKRTYLHNLRLATLLCFTAGIVNGAGFLAFMVLTTNVTGHAALLAVRLAKGNLHAAGIVALWLVIFLLGAFLSSLYTQWVGRNKFHAYTLPLLTEIFILCAVAVYGNRYDGSVAKMELFAGSLLFAMGLQNALVSMVSGSVVRTTHLTGVVTDLGIDLSFMSLSGAAAKPELRKRISLRIMIITSFLFGGFAGSYLFTFIRYYVFFIPALILIIAIFYDYFRVKWLLRWRRKSRLHFRKLHHKS
ncbi:MAG: YoaK family protein [Agriterribacter sp.]